MWEIELSIPLEDVPGKIMETDQRIKDAEFTRGPHLYRLKADKAIPRDSLEALYLRYSATISSEKKYMTGPQAARLMKNYWNLSNAWMTKPVKRKMPRKTRKPRNEPVKDVHWFTVPCGSDSEPEEDIMWDFYRDRNCDWKDSYLCKSPF